MSIEDGHLERLPSSRTAALDCLNHKFSRADLSKLLIMAW
jgi:hypothetical protein